MVSIGKEGDLKYSRIKNWRLVCTTLSLAYALQQANLIINILSVDARIGVKNVSPCETCFRNHFSEFQVTKRWRYAGGTILASPLASHAPCTTHTRVSMESRYQHLLSSLDWSWSLHSASFPVSMSLGLDIQEIFQSRHPRNFSVSLSLGLNIQ